MNNFQEKNLVFSSTTLKSGKSNQKTIWQEMALASKIVIKDDPSAARRAEVKR